MNSELLGKLPDGGTGSAISAKMLDIAWRERRAIADGAEQGCSRFDSDPGSLVRRPYLAREARIAGLA